VLVDSPNFDDGKGLKIHIRTKIVTWWSYIDTAVVKVGDDTVSSPVFYVVSQMCMVSPGLTCNSHPHSLKSKEDRMK
jgi:hypothetical protein